MGLSEAEWRYAVGTLREDGLLAKPDPAAPEALDAHPLVREHVGARLQASLPEAWRAGHERLYVHLTETTVEQAAARFAEAEAMQKERQPEYSLLYSLRGYQYCELLLDQSAAQAVGQAERVAAAGAGHEVALAGVRAVREWAAQTLKIAERNRWLLDIALDHLSLGRALLLEAVISGATDLTAAAEQLDQAVDSLRRAGQQQELPRGLLTRAALHRHRHDILAAETDLTEAADLITRCDLKLFEADLALETARLHRAQGDRAAAQASLDEARTLIERMGYHRRDWAVEELARSVAAPGL